MHKDWIRKHKNATLPLFVRYSGVLRVGLEIPCPLEIRSKFSNITVKTLTEQSVYYILALIMNETM